MTTFDINLFDSPEAEERGALRAALAERRAKRSQLVFAAQSAAEARRQGVTGISATNQEAAGADLSGHEHEAEILALLAEPEMSVGLGDVPSDELASALGREKRRADAFAGGWQPGFIESQMDTDTVALHMAQNVRKLRHWRGAEVAERPEPQLIDVHTVAVEPITEVRQCVPVFLKSDGMAIPQRTLVVSRGPAVTATVSVFEPGPAVDAVRFDADKLAERDAKRVKAADVAAFPFLFDDKGRRAKLDGRQAKATMRKVRARMGS